MSRKQYSLSKQLVVAAALALGASDGALADDSSMGRFGGDSYTYFNNQPVSGDNAARSAWRQSHPNGLTEREIQALSASDLSPFVAQLNPPVFASAPADPSWRLSHPNGLTEREMQALSASSLSVWNRQDGSAATTNVAQSPSNGTFSARLMNFLKPGSGTRSPTNY